MTANLTAYVLNSVSAQPVKLISMKPRVRSLKDRDSVGGVFEMDSSDWSNGI